MPCTRCLTLYVQVANKVYYYQNIILSTVGMFSTVCVCVCVCVGGGGGDSTSPQTCIMISVDSTEHEKYGVLSTSHSTDDIPQLFHDIFPQ